MVAVLTLGWLILAYRKPPLTAPLWPVENGLWAVVTAVMLIASVLLMGSLIRSAACTR
nr:NnrU family protein [Cupriavidus sp. UME77]